jgi:hypothetical protein
MWTGATFLGLPSFDLETFCRKSSDLQATDMHLVPPVALLLTTSKIARKYDVPSVERIVIAAAPLKVTISSLAGIFRAVCDVQYGMSANHAE